MTDSVAVCETPGLSAHAVHLSDAQRVLALFAQGLAERALQLEPTDALAAGFRPADGRTDGAALRLPAVIDAFDQTRHNFGAYRIAVLHQLGYLECGTIGFRLDEARARIAGLPQVHDPAQAQAQALALVAQASPAPAWPRPWPASARADAARGQPLAGPEPEPDLERFFALWEVPALARTLFATLEDLRVDLAMRTRYPGARTDLQRMIERALLDRPDPDTLAPVARLLEALVRRSLGDVAAAGAMTGGGGADTVQTTDAAHAAVSRPAVAVPSPETDALATPMATPETDALATLMSAADAAGLASANVYDSARAAVECYHALVRVGLPRMGPATGTTPVPVAPASPPGSPFAPPSGDIEAGPVDEEALGVFPVSFRGELTPELVRRLRSLGTPGALPDEAQMRAPTGPVPEAESEPGTRPARPAPGRLDDERLRGARSFLYDEWDYLRKTYLKGWCRLFELQLEGDDGSFLRDVRRRHPLLSHQVKRRFRFVKPESRRRVHRVGDGDELDLDGLIEASIDRRSGHASDEHLYVRRDKTLRDVAAAFLVDLSASTDLPVPEGKGMAAQGPGALAAPPASTGAAFDDDFPYLYAGGPATRLAEPAAPRRRVIDVAKDALALMCEALATLGDSFAIYGFSGEGRHKVEVHIAKEFEDRVSARTWGALAAMKPRRSTRMGPAIRHALAKLRHQPARMKVLIVVSDGYPQDDDYGPDRMDEEYGIQDTAKALEEAAQQGVQAFCVTIDPAGYDYMRRMCGEDRYLIIDDVSDLPEELTKVYRTLTTSGLRPRG